MKRDLGLIREIALALESVPNPNPHTNLEAIYLIEGHSVDEILYHLRLMFDEDLIEGKMIDSIGGHSSVNLLRLTARGYDFIDATQDPQVWDQILQKIREVGQSASIGIILELGKDYLKKKFGLS